MSRKMELTDTVDMMLSEDYKERFKAEYYQLKIRIKKLEELIEKYENDKLDFEPKTPIFILKQQLNNMRDYFCALDIRQALERIDMGKYIEL